MEINIRGLEKSHFEQLYALFDQIDNLHHDSIPSIFKRSFDKKGVKSHLENILISKTHHIVVAVDKNENVLGFGEYIIKSIENHKVFEDKKSINIVSIIVKKEYRCRGIGTKILKYIEDQTTLLKLDSTELMVWGFNQPAIKFYESNGYETLFKKLHKKR
ncbi:MAG: hypothetical protein CR982_02710 [Candidatus Cloacimonadota bacterium]|nr:MAG: hypothetical protein CR982_02710 [Candidatus Cloacimonadota bacterium]PIE79341.1 MAG: hypothetical protein CSA15_03565 [Candidatus Delongbacteria bacterium]